MLGFFDHWGSGGDWKLQSKVQIVGESEQADAIKIMEGACISGLGEQLLGKTHCHKSSWICALLTRSGRATSQRYP